MDTIHLFGTVIYFAMLVGLACYGLHRYWMIFLYYRHRKDVPSPLSHFPELPKITVQLPLYNELYVAERLLDAVAGLDYPKDRLQIQVLDDSTDETTGIVPAKVRQLRDQGFDISHIHRVNRFGFKAGALAPFLVGFLYVGLLSVVQSSVRAFRPAAESQLTPVGA